MISIIFINIMATADATSQLKKGLSHSEYAKSKRMIRTVDRNSYTAAHVLKRLVLANELKVSMNELQFIYDDYGKPSLVGGEINFNLSHTSEMVAFAWSKSVVLGVDVEKIPAHRYEKGVEEMVLSKEEGGQLNLTKCRQTSFIKLWTMKEAVAKAEGKGLSIDLCKISLVGDKATSETSTWNIRYYHPSPNHIASLAFPAQCNTYISNYMELNLEPLMGVAELKTMYLNERLQCK